MARLLTDEQIIKLYNEGLSYKELVPLCGLTDRSIRNVLYKHGIDTRKSWRRKYFFNEDFFKTWTNEMAWLLGFIYADGCIVGATQSIQIGQKNVDMLSKISSLIGLEKDITYRKDKCPVLQINSKTMKDDLINIGLMPNKSLVVKFPSVPDKYLTHFIRGVFDGDGWCQEKGYVTNITTGSKDFADGLLYIYNSWGLRSEISEEITGRNNVIYRVWVKGRESILKFAELLYKDSGDLFYEYKKNRLFQF